MYNDLQLRAFTQIAYIDLESKYNLLLNANHDLKNRYLHIDYNKNFQSATNEISKCQKHKIEKENGTIK